MKKMFITGMNMNEAKTYVEPEMKVIEVDVESLVAGSPDDNDDITGGADGTDITDVDTDADPFAVKKSNSLLDDIW